MDRAIEKTINEFISDVEDLQKSASMTQNRIWTNHLKEFLSKLSTDQSTSQECQTLSDYLIRYPSYRSYYDAMRMFLKLLLRKEPSFTHAGISYHTISLLQPEVPVASIEVNSKKTVSVNSINSTDQQYPNSNKIFIVHGHDGESKLVLSNMLEKMGLEPIILHEKANEGQTIIEKFEKHSNDVNFAFVLLTPDDWGGEGKGNLKRRARQNVILELGYFIAKLRRSKVCCLYKSDVELPTDMLGIIYIPFNNTPQECYITIKKELEAAGYLPKPL